MLKKEIELLESLGDMKDAALLMKTENKEEMNELDRQFRGLGMNESKSISGLLMKSRTNVIIRSDASEHNRNRTT
jgi:poly [ADP-ribose] polymerase